MTSAAHSAEPEAWLNAIGTGTPRHDVHDRFVAFAPEMLAAPRDRRLFQRMAQRSGIERRYSVLSLAGDGGGVYAPEFYRRGDFPDTARRMDVFAAEALPVAMTSLNDLARTEGPGWQAGISHLIVTCCTGFFAPGVDAAIIDRLGLDPGIERTLVGFMGCNAAFNALKLARHLVRSEPRARVLIVSLELCTLHLQETEDLEQALAFMIFADGAAAAIVSAEPRGLRLDRFASAMLREGAELISWTIGAQGFDMHLSGEVPAVLGRRLPAHAAALAGQRPRDEIAAWAVHPGGRSILDAAEAALELAPDDLAASREVLRGYGNMSSATIMFVLQRLMAEGPEGAGLAFGFGPGLSVESMVFEAAA